MKLSSNDWLPFCPLGSITFNEPFFPKRSTTIPFDNSICNCGSTRLPSLCGCDGLYFAPPKAHAIASSTLVLPWLFFPPTTVKPFFVGSNLTALTRFTFSSSRLLILIDSSCCSGCNEASINNVSCSLIICFFSFFLLDDHFICKFDDCLHKFFLWNCYCCISCSC